MSAPLEMIVARAANGVIGNAGTMPWHIPEDLRHFKTVTMGAAVIMGRKTRESIGRNLPGRTNIVISRNAATHYDGALTVPSLADALKAAQNEAKVFVLGGGQIYRAALPLAQTCWVTEIAAECAGDTTFPELPASEWKKRFTGSSRNGHDPDVDLLPLRQNLVTKRWQLRPALFL